MTTNDQDTAAEPINQLLWWVELAILEVRRQGMDDVAGRKHLEAAMSAPLPELGKCMDPVGFPCEEQSVMECGDCKVQFCETCAVDHLHDTISVLDDGTEAWL